MAVSSVAQAAQASTQAGTQPIFQPLPTSNFSGPGAGIYQQKQSQAQLAYAQAMADLVQKKNTAYHTFGLTAEGAVDPFNQYGQYQSLLSQHESELAAAQDAAQQRGLGGLGLANQAETALRYQHGGQDLALQQQIADTGYGYTSGAQAALAARNQAILDAQLSALQMQIASGGGGGGFGAYGGGGGVGGGSGSVRLQWSGGAQDALGKAGYSDEQISAAIYDTMAQRGWGDYKGANGAEPPQVMQNGQTFNAQGQPDPNGGYIMVKVGTPGGNSTELIYIGKPASQTQTPTDTNQTQTQTSQPTQTATQQAVTRIAQAILQATPTRSRAGRE